MVVEIVVPERSGNYPRREINLSGGQSMDTISQSSLFPLHEVRLKREQGRKRCPHCEKYKALDKFHVDSSKWDGRQAWCKMCLTQRARKRYAQGKVYTPKKQAYYRKRNYGIDETVYQAMLLAQDRKCAICHQPETAKKGTLSVDHSHVTGEIRGLLCYKCNSALGSLDDDPERIRALLEYLEKWA